MRISGVVCEEGNKKGEEETHMPPFLSSLESALAMGSMSEMSWIAMLQVTMSNPASSVPLVCLVMEYYKST